MMNLLDRKLLVLALATSAIATTLTFFLATAKVTQVIRQVQVDRLALLLQQVELVAENSLTLAIAVPEMRPLAQTLKRLQAADTAILNAEVYLPNGAIAHSTNLLRVGMVSTAPPMCVARAKEATEVFEYANLFRVTRSITNNFGVVAACAVFEVDAAQLAARNASARQSLAWACSLGFLLGSLALFFGLRWALRRFARSVESAADPSNAPNGLSGDAAQWRALFISYSKRSAQGIAT